MSHQDDRALTDALAAARDAGRNCALATIVATRGSTPRKIGARMLIDPEHGLVGTVGGGCGEAEVIEVAGRVLTSGIPERVQVDLTDDMLSWSPAVCGGIMDVFVEAVGVVQAVRPDAGRDAAGHSAAGHDHAGHDG
jgi:xanthine/CO dehydrogenase XdhC/CoxF family maturation factor